MTLKDKIGSSMLRRTAVFLAVLSMAAFLSAQITFKLTKGRATPSGAFSTDLSVTEVTSKVAGIGMARCEISVGNKWYLWDYKLSDGSTSIFEVLLYTGSSGTRPGIWFDYSKEGLPEILAYQPFFFGQPSSRGIIAPGVHRYIWRDGKYREQNLVVGQFGAWLMNPVPICW